MCDPIRLAVFVSGSGTNLQVFIDAIKEGRLKGEISLVISDNPEAYALVRAQENDIPAYYIDRKQFSSRAAYEHKLVEMVKEQEVDLVLLAGFMRILSAKFLSHFSGRVMNIHPSLLPAFPGLDAQQQALDYGVRLTGCTVHFVDEGMDTGPIILQSPVPIYEQDTRVELTHRIQIEEHHLYLKAVSLYQAGRLHIEGRKVKILPGEE